MDGRAIDYLILSFEPSSDLLGEKLISDLLNKNPRSRIVAVAGPKMRKHPIEVLFPMERLQVMGFVDVVKALGKIISTFLFLKRFILKEKPKTTIFIDYPDFNLRLEASLRKKGFKGTLIHYVSPSVWAWRKKRIFTMEKNLDHLFTILPFEKAHFSQTKLPVTYVGHPLVEKIYAPTKKRGPLLALFPGSRKEEIKKNLPFQIEIAKALQSQDPSLQIAISMASEEKKMLLQSLMGGLNAKLVPPDQTYSLMESARLAFATSGTVNLELALHETPTLVNYKISPLDLFLATKIFRISLPFYSIVNLIAEEEVFLEFFGPNLQKEPFLKAAQSLLFDEKKRNQCIQGCKKVRTLLRTYPNKDISSFI